LSGAHRIPWCCRQRPPPRKRRCMPSRMRLLRPGRRPPAKPRPPRHKSHSKTFCGNRNWPTSIAPSPRRAVTRKRRQRCWALVWRHCIGRWRGKRNKNMALTHTKDLFAKALKGKYALGAFNVNNMELLQAIVEACEEEKAPVMLQISKGARQYANPVYLKKLIEAAVSLSNIPIAVHLDHGDTFELCK